MLEKIYRHALADVAEIRLSWKVVNYKVTAEEYYEIENRIDRFRNGEDLEGMEA